MDGSLFAFVAEVRDAARVQCRLGCSRAIGLLVHKNADIPPREGGGNAPSRRRGAERGRVSTDDVAHRRPYCTVLRGSWFIVSNACVVPLPAATVCYTLALLSGLDGRAMCCLQYA